MPENKKNKVKFNLKNAHYALLTISEEGKETYGTPTALPGSVSISLDANGEPENFYADGVLIENADVELASFALLFEFDGDKRHIRHVLYNCSASRPGIEGKTNEESREVQTETLTIKATPLSNGMVKAKTGDETDEDTYNNWYTKVYVPGASEAVALKAKGAAVAKVPASAKAEP